jgi:hypothetical protein
MKRTFSTIALAAPLAIAALSLGASPASAESGGPGSDRLSSSDIGPVNPHLPQGPLDKIQPLDDPDPDPGPDGPDGPDVPDEPDVPDVPGDKTSNPTPCGTPEDRPEDTPEDEPEPVPGILAELEPADEDEDEPGDKIIPLPTCIDAGAGATAEGMELGWLMVGTGLITATGAAFAVRRRISTEV